MRRTHRGFSLIELLTVIAIIAVLMALIFPVVASVTKRSRQKACAANMHDIAVGLRMYEVDEGGYPVVLYGFVNPDESGPDMVVTGLYPNWVRSPATFACPNSPVLRTTNLERAMRLAFQDGSGRWQPADYLTEPIPVNEIRQGTWTLGGKAPPAYPSGARFASGDSYDLALVPTNNGVWERHYQRQYRPLLDLREEDPAAQAGWWDNAMPANLRRGAYARQLVFRQPTDDTLVTICPYHRDYPNGWKIGDPHRPNSRDNALFLDGHVEQTPCSETGRYDAGGWAGWQTPGKG